MTTAEKLAILKRWQAAIEKSDALINPVIKALNLASESPVNEAVWGLQREMTLMAAELVGDGGGWLEWHAYENAMGARGYEVALHSGRRSIRTLEDLLWVIEVDA